MEVAGKETVKTETWDFETGPPNNHSDAMHVVERFKRTGADTISYEAMIEDPKVRRPNTASPLRWAVNPTPIIPAGRG